jgi:Flp pilus assembly protein TadG
MRSRKNTLRGGAVVEFAIVLMFLLTIVLAGLEFDRLVLAYTTVANAARVGERYAIVHGSSRTGVGDPASGATDASKVIEVVKTFTSAGTLDPDKVDVDVTYPASTSAADPGNQPGKMVVVTVTYPYDPLTFLPFSLELASTTRGVIVF